MSQFEAIEFKARRDLHWQREKVRHIQAALNSDPVDISALRQYACSLGGLVHANVRKKVWPKLAGVNMYDVKPYSGPPLVSHKDRAQVQLDVNRCTKRIPKSYSEEKQCKVQEQLTRVILRLLAENSRLHYYQGLHDVVITFLLVAGEAGAYAIMHVLVNYHIRDFLDEDMGRTKLIIGYLKPLLALEDARLEEFVTRSECQYYFSLSWLITWFGHVVQHPAEAFRLADVFLASHPLMPVYVSAAMILSRRSEVLSLNCEMSEVHGLLSKIPDNLSYEMMVELALQLFQKHPPKKLARHGRLKLSASSLISSYSQFEARTRYQRPDHLLAQGLKNEETSWWAWRPTAAFVVRVLSFAGPVLIAAVLYWIQSYLRTSDLSITFAR